LLKQYPMTGGDVLVVASNSGRNACPVELAMVAKERSVRTIAVLNSEHSAKWASRHSSGKRLGDVVDLVIDNCGVEGDACVPLAGSGLFVGATSTVTGCLIMQMIACRATEMLNASGRQPELYQSSNANHDERNAALIAEHKQTNPHL
ncbi:MAG: sugar isomerase domain-containing protein, partial [Verrucomicrobia bacterium]|nr:sugar isomerase domain-containing protein [Verrucomicrobiota bacterium]